MGRQFRTCIAIFVTSRVVPKHYHFCHVKNGAQHFLRSWSIVHGSQKPGIEILFLKKKEHWLRDFHLSVEKRRGIYINDHGSGANKSMDGHAGAQWLAKH
jgi:hypothetical protein